MCRRCTETVRSGNFRLCGYPFSILKNSNNQLTEIGLDLSYHMEGLLRSTLEKLIEESRVRLVETIGRSEDVWQPYNLQTKSHLKTLLRELDNVGIDMQSQVTGDTWINLTQTIVNFCRHFLSVTESCGYLAKNETLKMNVEVLLRDMFLAQYECKPSSTTTVDVSQFFSFLSVGFSLLIAEIVFAA